MRNLTAANVRRLLKTVYFRISAALMAVIGLFEIIMVYRDYRVENGDPYFDGPLASVAPLTAFAIAVIVSLYVGSEYSDGTMRNKVIAGHSRGTVYLSFLVTSIIGGWILAAVWSVAYLVPGSILMKGENPPMMYGILYLVMLLLLCVFSAIFTFVSILFDNKAGAAVVCMVLALLLIFQGIAIRTILDEPEFYAPISPGVMVADYDEIPYAGEPEPNPNYLPEGSLGRKICTFLDDFTPGGQAIQLPDKIEDASKICAYDLSWIVILSGAGIILFRRKDLK